MLRNRFYGMYYKNQKAGRTVSLIAGASAHAFIQVITNTASYYFSYPLSAYKSGESIRIGNNIFSKNGVKIHIENGVSIHGEIKYTGLTPLPYDIMGPFRYLPMQCRHAIFSLHHRLEGSLAIDGETVDLNGGVGYIEGDSGTSFPKSYAWIQCNDFADKACIMASVADIPFAASHFRGCICVVYFNDTKYRLATYLGAKILVCNEREIILKQGKLRLEINVYTGAGHKLIAPEEGRMIREIRERIVCGARFRFTKGREILFEKYSENASFEYVPSN